MASLEVVCVRQPPAAPAAAQTPDERLGGGDPAASDASASMLEAVLDLLRERTGADFSNYRRATVLRRVRNRMISVGHASMDAYARLLADDVGEAAQLLQRITIKVSRFYRNAAAFERLGGELLPALARAANGRPLRLWSAGCGFGEEPYTLAMLLESMGMAGTVLATDLDDAALARARDARYSAEANGDLPATLHRYLEPAGDHVRVVDAVRSRVRFARHDLAGAALPEAGLFDLVCCRNVLIYFDRPLQLQVFGLLRRAIARGGALFLGEAEWPPLSWDAGLALQCRRSRLFRAEETVR